MNDTQTPIPFEQETIRAHTDIRLSKLRRIRDRALLMGEEYVRKGELVRIEKSDVYNGRRIRVMEFERQDVVKNYDPEVPNNPMLKYIIKLSSFSYAKLGQLIRRLVDRTTRLRRVLAKPDHGFTPKQVEMLNHQFITMARQLEVAVAEAKGRNHANA